MPLANNVTLLRRSALVNVEFQPARAVGVVGTAVAWLVNSPLDRPEIRLEVMRTSSAQKVVVSHPPAGAKSLPVVQASCLPSDQSYQRTFSSSRRQLHRRRRLQFKMSSLDFRIGQGRVIHLHKVRVSEAARVAANVHREHCVRTAGGDLNALGFLPR